MAAGAWGVTSNGEDRERLAAGTDMSYGYPEGEGEMIVFANGMNTDSKQVQEGVEQLAAVTGKQAAEIGVMHNDTDGIVGDVKEYAENGLRTQDVVNAAYLEQLNENGEQNLVVAHSAGNKDIKDAMAYWH